VALDPEDLLLALLPLVGLVGLLGLAAYAIARRSRHRELAHEERLAMIEKGMLPPPELAPLPVHSGRAALVKSRYRNFGILLTSLGVGIAFIVGVAAGAADIAIGVGGAIVALGVAFITISVLTPDEPPPTGAPNFPLEPDV
jgi:hypothetical protein